MIGHAQSLVNPPLSLLRRETVITNRAESDNRTPAFAATRLANVAYARNTGRQFTPGHASRIPQLNNASRTAQK
ncbi:hypothetical protein [Nocardia brasiliensis]|uniref:hypothetical protein n=1 Tax=Nocardia brasiliensis TaxID=37326 RepID=UPI0033BFE43F